MIDLGRRLAPLTIVLAFSLAACSEISTPPSAFDLIPVLTDGRVLLVVALIALGGFVSASLTREDRARWSLSMKVFMTLVVVTIVSIPLVLAFGPPPPPG